MRLSITRGSSAIEGTVCLISSELRCRILLKQRATDSESVITKQTTGWTQSLLPTSLLITEVMSRIFSIVTVIEALGILL